MKSTLMIIFSAFSLVLAAQNTPGIVDISVTTQPDGKAFSPKHVLAIWIEDASGNFIKTLKMNADRRKQYLYTWNEKSGGNTNDAITGATLNSHGTQRVSWDCTNASGTIVNDGNYSVQVEFTSEHAQGPMVEISFDKSSGDFSVQPDNENNFTDMDLVYTPESTSGIEQLSSGYEFKVYPLPASKEVFIEFQLLEEQEIKIMIHQSDMKLVRVLESALFPAGKHRLSWNRDNANGSKIPAGIYFITISGQNKYSTRQILVQ